MKISKMSLVKVNVLTLGLMFLLTQAVPISLADQATAAQRPAPAPEISTTAQPSTPQTGPVAKQSTVKQSTVPDGPLGLVNVGLDKIGEQVKKNEGTTLQKIGTPDKRHPQELGGVTIKMAEKIIKLPESVSKGLEVGGGAVKNPASAASKEVSPKPDPH